jgi:hypothetical protein
MRYADAVIIAEGGTLVADLTKIGALEPDTGEHLEPDWTEWEEATESTRGPLILLRRRTSI